MVKYQFTEWDYRESITVDESAKEDIKKMMEWSEEDWNKKMRKVE